MRARTLFLSLFLVLAVAAPQANAQGNPGELVIALSSLSAETVDPILGGQIVKFYLGMMYDTLVGATPDGRLSRDTGLATKWETSADAKRITFTLRKGVKFHNGDDVTSEDVKFSINRAMGPRSTTGYASGLKALVKDIEAPAPDRLVITTKEPTVMIPTYLSRLLSTEGMVLSKKYLEAKGDDGFMKAPIGSGPYRYVELVSGSHIKLEAVPGHWRTGAQKYKTIVYKVVPEETTRIAMLRRGEADIVEVSRERTKEVEKAGFPVALRKEDVQVECWWINGTGNLPHKDKRVREAFNVAIDRKELISTIYGDYGTPASISWALSWGFPEIKFKVNPEHVYAYDPARAKKLLADAGFPNGFPVQIYSYQLPGFPEGRAHAEALAGYWQKVGLQPKLVPVDYPAFRKTWIERSAPGSVGCFNVANRDWIGTYAILDKYVSPAARTATVEDPELTKMMEAVAFQADPDKAHGLMRNILNRMRTEHHGMPIVYLHTPYAVSKRVGKWNPGSVMYELNLEEIVGGK